MHALYDIPIEYPMMPIVGLGPGQFSSRAALIGTGMYFGGDNPRQIPFLPQGSSRVFQDYLEGLWMVAVANPFWGSTQKPFYSWLSVYTEFGVMALVIIFGGAVLLLVRLKRAATNAEGRVLATATGGGIILFLLLGLQENYWETPQALFVGLMLLKPMYGQLVHRAHGDRASEAAAGIRSRWRAAVIAGGSAERPPQPAHS
jgi:hypothetical protein